MSDIAAQGASRTLSSAQSLVPATWAPTGQPADDPALGRGHGRRPTPSTSTRRPPAPPDGTAWSPRPRCCRRGPCAASCRPRWRGTTGRVPTSCSPLLDAAGYSSVVATDSEQEYFPELRLGDRVSVTEVIESIFAGEADRPRRRPLRDHAEDLPHRDGEVVATQRWRTLRFKPGTESPRRGAAAPRPGRRSTSTTRSGSKPPTSTVWSSSAARPAGRCGIPPGPMCPDVPVDSSGTRWRPRAAARSTASSSTTTRRIAAFDYPLIVALIELEEGTRLIANIVGIEPDEVEIDMPVELDWIDAGGDLTLPAFRPAVREGTDGFRLQRRAGRDSRLADECSPARRRIERTKEVELTPTRRP